MNRSDSPKSPDSSAPATQTEANGLQGWQPNGMFMPLEHLGLIAIAGDDAADFLHNQLSNDVLNLPEDRARLAAYCSPKGRMLANFLMWRQEGHIVLQCPRVLQPAIQKRLAMFVLRAKAKLTDATTSFSAWGLAGENAATWLRARFGRLPDAVWDKIEATIDTSTAPATEVLIRVPDANGLQRWLLIAPAHAGTSSDHLAASLTASAQTAGLVPASAAIWRWLDIRAGLPAIAPTTQEHFVPQMINFEALGGVDFRKGCYPGQEVVARSQYLGKLKRRMALAHAALDEPPTPGSDVFEQGSDQPVGEVVNAERSPLGGVDLLLELPLAVTAQGSLGVSGLTAPLEILDLPYPLPDNEVFVRPKL